MCMRLQHKHFIPIFITLIIKTNTMNNITINTGGIIKKTIPEGNVGLAIVNDRNDRRKKNRFQHIQNSKMSFGSKNSMSSRDAQVHYITKKEGNINPTRHSSRVMFNSPFLKLQSLDGNDNSLKISFNIDLLLNNTGVYDFK